MTYKRIEKKNLQNCIKILINFIIKRIKIVFDVISILSSDNKYLTTFKFPDPHAVCKSVS